jgi:hypothetical protein
MTAVRMLTVALVMAVLIAACGSSTSSGDNASTDTTVGGRALDLGGQDGETTLPSNDAQPLDDKTLSPLLPGTYRTGLLEPPVTFTVGDDWHLDLQGQNILVIGYETYNPFVVEGQTISVVPVDLFRVPPVDRRRMTTEVSPEEFATWPEPSDDLARDIAGIDHVESGDVVSVEIAGIAAEAFDYEVSDLPDLNDACKCIALLVSESGFHSLDEGTRGRLYVVDLGETEVVIDITAAADEFDRFLPFAEAVIETMSFS